MKTTHVLIALQRFQAGGAERQAWYLAKGLIERGYRVTVFAFGDKGGLGWERFMELKTNLVPAGFNEKLITYRGARIVHLLRRWYYRRKLIRLIKQINPSVILPFTYVPNTIFGGLWRLTGATTCYWNQRDEGRWFQGRPWELHALRNVTRVISNNLEGKMFLQKYADVDVKVIHNGVVIPTTAETGKEPKRLRAVMIANLKKFKDHETLLKAWRLLVHRPDFTGAELLLVGKKAETALKLENFVKENNLEDSVVFCGQVADVNAVLESSDIGVFSSLTEGVPNGVLECMAVGLPVIATDIIGTREALGEDPQVLARREDPEDMAEKIHLLLTNADLRKKIGQRNLERVRDLFNINRMVDEYTETILANSH